MNGSGTSRDLRQRISPGIYSPRRRCTGPCGVMRSITQFTGASTMCKRCVRRAPKET